MDKLNFFQAIYIMVSGQTKPLILGGAKSGGQMNLPSS